jgi:shikimate kinase
MTHIFLYGPPGTGKSTIGKKLSASLKLSFIDLDRIIETNAGVSIPQIMEQQGETTFRDLETAALKNLANEKGSVIALGGGALLRDENRAFAESHGKVVLLMANVEILFQRLNESHTKRPLLAGDLHEKLTSLLEKRGEH